MPEQESLTARWQSGRPAISAPRADDGAGCHAGAEKMRAAATAAGKQEVLERYARDYPGGAPRPAAEHVPGLRVPARRPAYARTATVLCGSACCVYGLTFTSHFYGARRTVGYVPFDSETLVTGKLFEDLREAVLQAGRSGQVRRHRGDQPLRADRLGCAAGPAAERDQRRAHHRHRCAGLRRADARGGQGRPRRRDARLCARRGGAGPRRASQRAQTGLPTVALVGEMFPVDAGVIGRMLEPLGLAAGPVVPTREWRELYAALDCPVGGDAASLLHGVRAPVQRRRPPLVGSAPVGVRRHGRLAQRRSATPAGVAATRSPPRRTPCCRRSRARWRPRRSTAHHPVRLRGLGAAGGAPAHRSRRRRALRRHRLPEDALVRSGSRVARGQGRAGQLSRVAGTGHRGVEEFEAGPRDRHHTGGPACQGASGFPACTSPT
jgi:hypothetical protein